MCISNLRLPPLNLSIHSLNHPLAQSVITILNCHSEMSPVFTHSGHKNEITVHDFSLPHSVKREWPCKTCHSLITSVLKRQWRQTRCSGGLLIFLISIIIFSAIGIIFKLKLP
jgi:hypothetical protein